MAGDQEKKRATEYKWYHTLCACRTWLSFACSVDVSPATSTKYPGLLSCYSSPSFFSTFPSPKSRRGQASIICTNPLQRNRHKWDGSSAAGKSPCQKGGVETHRGVVRVTARSGVSNEDITSECPRGARMALKGHRDNEAVRSRGQDLRSLKTERWLWL